MKKIIPTSDIAINAVHCPAGVAVEVSDIDAVQRVNDRQAIYAPEDPAGVETASVTPQGETASAKSDVKSDSAAQ